MRVRAVARRRGDADARDAERRAPVTQEPQLVSSGAGPVVEVEGEEQRALGRKLGELDGLDVVAEERDVGDAIAGRKHTQRLDP